MQYDYENTNPPVKNKLYNAGNIDLHGAPFLILGNKQDAVGAIAAVELKQRLGLGKVDSRAIDVQPCSALTGDGLQPAIDWLVHRVKQSQRTEVLRRSMKGYT